VTINEGRPRQPRAPLSVNSTDIDAFRCPRHMNRARTRCDCCSFVRQRATYQPSVLTMRHRGIMNYARMSVFRLQRWRCLTCRGFFERLNVALTWLGCRCSSFCDTARPSVTLSHRLLERHLGISQVRKRKHTCGGRHLSREAIEMPLTGPSSMPPRSSFASKFASS
jgi:hypothetical protein